jgi:hypothetical protein
MGRAFADRWGVPVQAGRQSAVAQLDDAVEELAALAGDPVAGAEAAVAADEGLVLGQVYRAYLALYGMTAAGIATATAASAPATGSPASAASSSTASSSPATAL